MTHRNRIQFEKADARRFAVRITHSSRSPVIATLHRAVLALGIVVASYELHSDEDGLLERLVLEERDGGRMDKPLRAKTRAAVLRVVTASEGWFDAEPGASSPDVHAHSVVADSGLGDQPLDSNPAST